MATDAQRKANTKYKEKCKGKFAEMRYRGWKNEMKLKLTVMHMIFQ